MRPEEFYFSLHSTFSLHPFCTAATFRWKPAQWLLCFALLALFGCKTNSELFRPDAPRPRIVSFAPSITETIFAIGGEQHLVGVTDFCLWPPRTKDYPKVGGYINPNYEKVLSLKPDCVIMITENSEMGSFLRSHSIRTLSIYNEDIAGIIRSFSQIGAVCNRQQAGDSLANVVSIALQRARSGSAGHCLRPSILLCAGRDKPGSGTIGKVFAAGPKTFYSELLLAAGGVNAITDSTFGYPSLSAEGIVHLAPDIIIDLMSSTSHVDSQLVVADWNSLTMLNAVKSRSVYALTGDYLSIPGPRIVDIYNAIYSCLDDWKSHCRKGE